MNDNKGQTIFLSVIGIATLLVAIIGATFAYFTTQIEGGRQNVNATTGTLGKVNFSAEAISLTNILPGKTSDQKTLTVSLGASDFDVKYVCYMEVTGNEVADMYLNLTDDTTNPAGSDIQTLADSGKLPLVTIGKGTEGQEGYVAQGEAKKIEIAKGTLTSGATKALKYQIEFKETGLNQNSQQGASFNSSVYCTLESADGVYYNNTYNTGTTDKTQIPVRD